MSNVENRQCQSASRGRLTGRRGTSAGFTLLELLITMLLIAILSSLAGPSFVDLIAENRRQSSLGSIFGMLSTARSEAVTRADTVVACGSADQSTCNSTSWENGWIVFADDGAGAATADDGARQADEELIRVGQAAGGDITIRTRNFPNAGRVSFNQDGFAEDSGTFVVCDGDPKEAAALVLNLSGQARMAVDENANEFLNIDTGEVTSCP